MDFKGSWDEFLPLVEFLYNNSFHASIGMPPYEGLYGRKCRTPLCWDEVGERRMLGPEMVQQTADMVELIRTRLVAAQDRQRKYADPHRENREFDVGYFVFLKVSPWKGKIRFRKKGKLSPRFVGPFEILRRVGEVAYVIALPPKMERIHNVFHVSVLRPYKPDYKHVIKYESIQIEKDLSYEELPIQIIDRKEQVLRNKVIPSVKVLWRNHNAEEATWELESKMKEDFPHLFM